MTETRKAIIHDEDGHQEEVIEPERRLCTEHTRLPQETTTMATTRTLMASIRQENGHQVIVLPEEIRFEGSEVLLRQDTDSGEVTVLDAPPRTPWQEFKAWRDAHPIPKEDWALFDEAIRELRETRQPPDDDELDRLFRSHP